MTEQIDFTSDPALNVYVPMKNGSLFEIPFELVEIYQQHYPRIDVQDELHKLVVWNISNPRLRKTERGMLRHINQWLSRAQERKNEGSSTIERVREATGGRRF